MRASEMTALDLLQAFRNKKISAEEALRDYLAQISKWEPSLGAVLTLCEKSALQAAKRIDKKRSKKEPLGLLAGLPIGIKDILSTKNIPTTCGSKMLENYVPIFDATVIRRLQQSDAILLAKLNLDEFAMGSSTENSAFFPSKNPYDFSRVPGGSSGGSAAAVAARLVPFALGTDTGGSIRQPASFCGVVGCKPTYGRVSRYGLIAYASSLDQIGPLARNVSDCAVLLQAISGYDLLDSTSVPQGVPSYLRAVERGIKGLRIGLPKEYFSVKGISKTVEKSVKKAINTLAELGAEVKEISLPHTKYALPTYYLIATAEASANLARYDGIRYGHRSENVDDLLSLYEKTRSEGFGPEVKRRIMLGTYALSTGYYEAFYQKAQEVRSLFRQDFETAFETVDIIATPTSPTTAFPLGERVSDPLHMYLADIFTLPCNLAGIPGISVPCGVDSKGLPIGLQLLGKHFDEESLFAAAGAYEEVRGVWENVPTMPENTEKKES